jgi:hypothetical protein
MAGYIGSKTSVTIVDGYNKTTADSTFVDATGDTMTGNLSFGDNNKAIFGAGSDLQIYHDGTNSYIDDTGTGNLLLRGASSVRFQSLAGENMVVADQNGAVFVYHDNLQKLATTATGIDVTGTIDADSATISGSVSGFGGGEVRLGTSAVNLDSAVSTYGSGTPSMFFDHRGTSTGKWVWRSSSSERMTLDASGNLGIGTSSPSSFYSLADNLVVGTGSGGNGLTVYSGSANSGYIGFNDTASASMQGFIQYNHNGDYMAFAPNGSEKVRVDSSGHVGIGVTPYAWGPVIRALQINTTGMSLFTYTAGGTTDQYAFLTNNSYQNGGYADVYVRTNPAAQYRQLNNVHAWYNAPSGAAGTAISFTQAMTLDSSGNLNLAKTASSMTVAGCRLGANGGSEIVTQGNNNTALKIASTDDAYIALVEFYTAGGTYCGYILGNGSATSYMSNSDYRLKENIVDLTGATERLKQLPVRRFNFINNPSETVDGFLAHEAQAVVPEAVHGTKDAMRDEEYEVTAAVLDDDGRVITEAVMGTRSVPDMQGIDQSKLVPLLTAALQEALNKIDAMETRLAALEAV